jgi:hypothetical protein
MGVVEVEIETGGDSARMVRISELAETDTEPIVAMMEAQDAERQTKIDSEFRQVYERACKAGVMCLIEESRWERHGLDIADDLAAMSNHYERAMWVSLRHPKVFKNAGYFQRMDGVTFKKTFAWKGLVPRDVEAELGEFKEKLMEYYKQEGRGKHCRVEVLKRTCPERYCYFVYLEDYGDTLEEWKGPKFTRTPVKPAFKVVFVYYPESGRIETSAKGRKAQVKKLLEVFCQGVLNMEKLPDKDSQMYDLEKLKDRFDFGPRDPQDNIAYVKLKMIELELTSKRRITFLDYIDGSDIYDLIDNALNTNNVPLDAVTVSQARIQIVFRQRPDESKAQTVTFDIGTPDRCSLKDTPPELIAQKCIEMWGLVSDETIEAGEVVEETVV